MKSIDKLVHKARHSFFLFGLASILWFIFRTGSKPTRMSYPCQQASAASGSLWIASYMLPIFLAAESQGRRIGRKRMAIAGSMMILLLLLSSSFLSSSFLSSSLFSFYGSFGLTSLTESSGDEQAEASRDDAIMINLSQMRSQFPEASDIFAVPATTGNDDALARLIELMNAHGLPFYAKDASSGVVGKNDVVIIKVNSQWDERGGTNSDLVRSLVQAILNHPDGFSGEVIIADNGQGQFGSTGHGGSMSYARNNAENISQSMQSVADSFPNHRVSAYLWDRITDNSVGEYADGDMADGYVLSGSPDDATKIAVTYPKFKTKYGTCISFKQGIWDATNGSYNSSRLKVLNVPVLKTHAIYGVTGCIKHFMGIVSDRLSRQAGGRAHDSVGSGGMGTEMVQTRFPDLNILDAIWINAIPGGGPSTSYSEADQVGIIAASIDPVALDYWAAKNILMPAARQKGYSDLESLDPDNGSPDSFGYWLHRSSAEILEAGHPGTASEKNMNVYLGN